MPGTQLQRNAGPGPVFVVSTGRVGTKFLSRFFAEYGTGMVSLHCPPETRIVHVLANMYERGVIGQRTMTRCWRRLRAPKVREHVPRRYVESNNYYYNLIDVIAACHADAKFVLIVRHPRGFIQSFVDWERYQWKSLIAARLIPFWQPVSYLEQIRGWLDDYGRRVEFYARVWTRKNEATLRNASDKERLRVLKYEELFDPERGPEILSELMQWLDAPLAASLTPERLTERVNRSRRTRRDEWDAACDTILRRHCGRLMTRFGYAS